MNRGKDLDERKISQLPAMELLQNIGYELIDSEIAEAMRGSLYKVILKEVLEEKLREINSFEYMGEKYNFSDRNIEQAIQDIDEDISDNLIKTNEKIHNSLLLGRSYPEQISGVDGTKSFNINYIDWENPDNNVYHVVEEFSVERMDGKGTFRPDIVLFINGLPIGVIECKRSSISADQGISQMIRNQEKDGIPNLFKFVQIVMATNKNKAMYATTGTPKKFWSIWKEDEKSTEYSWFQGELERAVVDRIPTAQDKTILALFNPQRVLDLIKYFTLFDKNVKKIARYQQYFAIKEIIKTIEERDKDDNRQSGVIWHTQGSGKSLTMVMLARYILSELSDIHPKVLVITDRIELDGQIHKTFNHSRLKAAKAATGRKLVELINDNSADIITSLVHKFDTAVKHQEPVDSKDIFVLIDESHRTQYGELHIKMKKVFPNACYLGFTGTPLMKKEKKTIEKFGSRMIHKYTIKDGVDDGAIVPLLYEGRLVEQSVNRAAIDKRIEMITRNLNDKQSQMLKDKWSKFEAIASSEQRIRLIADDIYIHFKQFYRGTPFKAMLATSSRYDAVRYFEAFEEYRDLNTAVVMSPPDQREGYEEVDKEPKDRILKFWNELMKNHSDPHKYEERVKSEFVDGDEIDILIVVDKLLTGFDAPRASVLYIDKPIKEHNLLQAVARVNRLYEGKDFGLIVDYRGLIQELDSAMKTYSGAGLENFDEEDISGALIDVVGTIGSLNQAYSELKGVFRSVKNREDIEEYELILADDETRNDFYSHLCQFGKYIGIALESEKVYDAIAEEKLKKYKRDLKLYQELRASVKLRYSDSIDFKEYEPRMRNIMDSYIASEDIVNVIAPVDILDKEGFEDELSKLGSKRGKADAIKTRLTRSINAKWDEDPAFYKKFSERIADIIEEYKLKRISDAEYLDRMNEIREDYSQGHSGANYPDKIKENKNAQAFYGLIKENIEEYLLKEKNDESVSDSPDIYNYENMLVEIALDIDSIVDENVKVDWKENKDVHNTISRELGDMFFTVKKEKFPALTYDQIDKIIDNIIVVALRRY